MVTQLIEEHVRQMQHRALYSAEFFSAGSTAPASFKLVC